MSSVNFTIRFSFKLCLENEMICVYLSVCFSNVSCFIHCQIPPFSSHGQRLLLKYG